MQSFTTEGHWWLPEDAEHKVPGTLTVRDTGAAELTLNGTLRSFLDGGITTTSGSETVTRFTRSSMAKAGRYERIAGQAGNSMYTLVNSFQVQRAGSPFGGVESERVVVNQVLQGAAFDDGEAIAFQTVYAEMDWLAYWVGKTGISHDFTHHETANDTVSENAIAIQSLPREQHPGPHETELILGQTWSITGDGIRERSLTQDFYVGVVTDVLLPIDDLLAAIGSLQDLVSMGTHRVAAYTDLTFQRSDLGQQRGQRFHPQDVRYIVDFHARSQEPVHTITEHLMFFSMNDLGGFEGAVRWVRQAASVYRSQLSRVMATRYQSTMYVSDRLLNYAAALEAYDKQKYSDTRYFKSRIERCAAWAGPVFTDLVGDPKNWSKKLKTARNDVAHHNPGIEGSATQHLLLAESAYVLFVLSLLREADAPQMAFDRVGSHPYVHWLKERLMDLS